MADRLTEGQRKRLLSLTDEWRCEKAGWRPDVVFLRLEQRGLCKSDLRYLPDPNNRRWWTVRTYQGRRALETGGAE